MQGQRVKPRFHGFGDWLPIAISGNKYCLPGFGWVQQNSPWLESPVRDLRQGSTALPKLLERSKVNILDGTSSCSLSQQLTSQGTSPSSLTECAQHPDMTVEPALKLPP